MRVCILGSASLNIDEEDVLTLVKRFVYPNEIDTIVTTNEEGIASTAREIAQKHGLPSRVFDFYRKAVEDSNFVAIVREKKDFPTYARWCNHVGKPFQEYVVVRE